MGPTTVTAKPKTSWQKQKHHGKTKNLTAKTKIIPRSKTINLMEKTKYLTAKPKTSRQNQKPRGKNKNIAAKPKTSWQKQTTSRQNQKSQGKTKYFTAKTK